MLPKKGRVFPYPTAIAQALQNQLGTTHQAIKTIMRWTGAGERTAKNWLIGTSGPNGDHLVELIRHSDEVLEILLQLAGRKQISVATKVADVRNKLAEMLRQIDELIDRRRD
jgi:hypothetical protein